MNIEAGQTYLIQVIQVKLIYKTIKQTTKKYEQ